MEREVTSEGVERMSSENGVVIVTGAAGGLGSAVARRFRASGAKVVLMDRNEAAVKKLAAEIDEGNEHTLTYSADLLNYASLQAMAAATVERWGRIDIVLNTAGGTLAMLTKKDNKALLDQTEEEWDLVVNVNLKGSFNCVRAVAPYMIQQQSGHIILVASGTGIRPGPRMSSYAAAKAGVLGLMKSAARDLGEYNVQVNAVNPGLITHELLALGGASAEGYTSETMLGRLSSPEEFADFVVYISQMKSISGQIYNVDSRVLF